MPQSCVLVCTYDRRLLHIERHMADLQISENAKVGVLAGSSTREFEFEVTPMSSMVGKGP